MKVGRGPGEAAGLKGSLARRASRAARADDPQAQALRVAGLPLRGRHAPMVIPWFFTSAPRVGVRKYFTAVRRRGVTFWPSAPGLPFGTSWAGT